MSTASRSAGWTSARPRDRCSWPPRAAPPSSSCVKATPHTHCPSGRPASMFMITGGEQPASRPIGTKHDAPAPLRSSGLRLASLLPAPMWHLLEVQGKAQNDTLCAMAGHKSILTGTTQNGGDVRALVVTRCNCDPLVCPCAPSAWLTTPIMRVGTAARGRAHRRVGRWSGKAGSPAAQGR
jgi:hypothetical protein